MQDTSYVTIGNTVIEKRTFLKRIVVISISIIIFVFLLLVFLLNGILDTSRIDKTYKVTVYRLSDNRPSEAKDIASGNMFNFIEAGRYAVFYSKEGTKFHYGEQIEVKNFLRKLVLSFDTKKQAGTIQSTSISSPDYINQDAAVSFRAGGTKIYNETDPLATDPIDTCDKTCFKMQSYTEGEIIGLLGDEGRAKRVGIIVGNNSTPTPIDSRYYPDNSQLIVSNNSTAFAVYNGKKHISYYADSSATPTEINLEDRPAMGENGRMISISNNAIAILYGNDYHLPTSGDASESLETLDGDYRLVIHSTKTGEILSQSILRNHTAIRSIATNPNATKFALITDNTVESGLVKTGSIDSVWPELSSFVSWINDTTFAYSTGQGVYAATGSTVRPLLASNSISISNLNNVGGRLFSSVIYKDDAGQQLFPVIINPNDTEIANNLLSFRSLKSTPYYVIEFNGQEFRLYLPTLDDGSKATDSQLKPAYDYMNSVAPNAKVVVFR